MSSATIGEKTKTGLGATLTDGGVFFKVWAPFASEVAVMGSFNEWSQTAHKLTRDDDGCWSVEVPGAKVGQEYKYVVKNGDKTFERNDPRALQLTAAGDASIVVDPVFDWEGDTFSMPDPSEQVIYELHIGTFNRTDPATPGTFASAAEKLDYLAALGVNVVELMPVSGTNAERWWGYDPNYLYAVEAEYGGRQEFLKFVKAAHQRGIGVVVDVVYNHLSPFPGLDLWQFDGWSEDGHGGIYFYNDWRGDTPWGPRLDYGRPEVRQYINENVRMWVEDCHVDGLRVDAVFQIRNALGRNDDPGSDLPDGWRVLQELTRTISQVNPKAMSIGEDMAINEWITKPESEGGAGFRAQWETVFPVRLREALEPLNDDDRRLQPLLDELAKKYNGQAFQRVIYSESHDADANGHARMNEEIEPGHPDGIFARRRSALAVGMVFTSPGIPMLFQGQEFLENGWFNHWDAIDWSRVDNHGGIIQLYSDLAALRRNQREITAGLKGEGFDTLHLDEKTKVLAYHRWDKGGPKDDTVVIANLSNQTRKAYELKFPQNGSWKVRFNSDWKGYSEDFDNTPTPDVEVSKNLGSVNLGPYSMVILSQD